MENRQRLGIARRYGRLGNNATKAVSDAEAAFFFIKRNFFLRYLENSAILWEVKNAEGPAGGA